MTGTLEAFAPSKPLTLGVELELQLLSSRDYDLTRAATDLLTGLRDDGAHGEVKLEVTESMIEVNTRPRTDVAGIHGDLQALRDLLVNQCARHNITISGGGSHPFHHWPERRICPSERFEQLYDRYGYLAKQFTVFGQHIHVGCASGDQAIWLTHALQRYIPHFIALSASSPYQDSTDTAFESSRLTAVSAFPLSGQAPSAVTAWDSFAAYFELLQASGVVESIKDLYWDIRPKPEYGTVEIRVCDTPLTIERATGLAAFAQCVTRYLLRTIPPVNPQLQEYVARFNKFQACRYGFDGMLAEPVLRSRISLRDDLNLTLSAIKEDADHLGCGSAIAALAEAVRHSLNGAHWLRREIQERHGSYNDVVRSSAALFAQATDRGSP
jgi:carboxylate-amine ligase